MIQTKKLSWATVNTDDPLEMAEFRSQQERLAGVRVKAAFERLKSLGVIDEHGESIGDELPPDMIPGAERDFGGWCAQGLMRPKMIVVAGPPGSGKSVAFPVDSFEIDCFNADDRSAQLNNASYLGISVQTWAIVNREFEQFVEDHIRRRISFAIETTLRSEITFHQMDRARVQGFELHMLYIALRSFSLNLKRVTDRARTGGHSAPAEQLLKIHQASLANLLRAVREVENLDVYDNTAPGEQPQLVLSARNGVVTFRVTPCPQWLKKALDRTEYETAAE
jgi:predicted ABC-type ATPase